MISSVFVKYMNGSCFFVHLHNPVPLLCLKPRCLPPPKTSVIQIKARISEGADHGPSFDRMLPPKQDTKVEKER